MGKEILKQMLPDDADWDEDVEKDVHDSYTERYPLGAESVHEVQVFVIGIGVETAPPIAESITWQHRRPSAEFEKVIKSHLIFKAVTEEI